MKLRDLLTAVAMVAMASTLFALEPDDPALVGVWLFDEGEGDEIGDSSGNDNAGLMGFDEDFEWGEGKFGGGLAVPLRKATVHLTVDTTELELTTIIALKLDERLEFLDRFLQIVELVGCLALVGQRFIWQRRRYV